MLQYFHHVEQDQLKGDKHVLSTYPGTWYGDRNIFLREALDLQRVIVANYI